MMKVKELMEKLKGYEEYEIKLEHFDYYELNFAKQLIGDICFSEPTITLDLEVVEDE